MAATLAILLAAPIGAAHPAAIRAATPDLTLVTDAVYTVRPRDGLVSVAAAVEVRNRTQETLTRRFSFDHAFLAVQPDATNLRLAGIPGARVRAAKRSDASTLLRLDFGRPLYSGERATLQLTFDLPGTRIEASPQVRVGSGQVTLPVWAYASDGARGSTVTVRFPAGWDVTVESGALEPLESGGGGGVVLESGPLIRPLSFFAYVTAERPAAVTEQATTLQVDGREVVLVLQVRGDDPDWARRVEQVLGRVLPVLGEDIGLPWPLDTLTVAETASREADAWAARFEPAERRLEIAWWAEDTVIVRQAAHGWFNGALLADRWANVGFAILYAQRAGDVLGEPVEAPVMPPDAEAAALPLDAWSGMAGTRTPADGYALAASASLAAEIAGRVGPEALRAVWADAAARVGAYQPAEAAGGAGLTGGNPAGAELVGGPPDWRGLLDLLEGHSGQDLVPLWREFVVAPEEAPLLDARAAARAAYQGTIGKAGDWALPRAIREAMRAWDFPVAESLLADARTIITQRDAVAALAREEGLLLPDAIRASFEAGAFGEASARAEEERNAILAVRRAAAARTPTDDLLGRISMLGEEPEQLLAEAREALAAGDPGAALTAADRAYRAWTIGPDVGRLGALLALLALDLLLAVVLLAVTRWRRSRRAAIIVAGGEAAGAAAAIQTTSIPAGRAPADGPSTTRIPAGRAPADGS